MTRNLITVKEAAKGKRMLAGTGAESTAEKLKRTKRRANADTTRDS